MTKDAARKHFRQQRQLLPEQEYLERNEALLKRARQFISRFRPRLVHSFLPILKHKEVNTWPLLTWLWSQNIGVAVSRSSLSDNSLLHFRCNRHTTCRENAWGIPEPSGDDLRQITVSEIDLVLVPLLAFDRVGHRVGYGKGYYDRFLAACRPDTIKLGLSLFPPLENIPDVSPRDVRLDAALTPDKVWLFTESVSASS